MNLIVDRHIKYHKYIYESKDYHAETNFTFNIGLRKIVVWGKDDESIYMLRQTNWLCKIITWIPLYWILPIGLFPQYKFYDRGICLGRTKISFFSPRRIIIIDNICYELYLHNNNYVSILKNNLQIALLKK